MCTLSWFKPRIVFNENHHITSTVEVVNHDTKSSQPHQNGNRTTANGTGNRNALAPGWCAWSAKISSIMWSKKLSLIPVPPEHDNNYLIRGVINGKAGKAGKAAAVPKFSDTLTLSQPGGGGRLRPLIGFASPKFFRDYAPAIIGGIVVKNVSSRVHISSDTPFFKIPKKPSIVQK